MRFEDSWAATWEDDALHIAGTTDLFPNDYSTASLQRIGDEAGGRRVVYALVFARDKEPFCGKDLVGPVHYFERDVPRRAQRIRIIDHTSRTSVELVIPPRRTRRLWGRWF